MPSKMLKVSILSHLCLYAYLFSLNPVVSTFPYNPDPSHFPLHVVWWLISARPQLLALLNVTHKGKERQNHRNFGGTFFWLRNFWGPNMRTKCVIVQKL